MRTRVCVYGVRTAAEAMAAAEGGADAIGLVFRRGSGRFVAPQEAWAIAQGLPPFVASVGVFTDASVEDFSEVEEQCPTDFSQLHGEEEEEVVRQCGPRVIKTVRFDAGTVAAELVRWNAVDEVDAVLVTFGEGGIGAGSLAALAEGAREVGKALMVGGGLTAANVGGVIRAVRLWAVGVQASVVDPQGQIDHGLVAGFVAAVRAADLA